ncbi:MAG: sulfatase-like hydrolase/transferase [Vicinamibacteria bacterium]
MPAAKQTRAATVRSVASAALLLGALAVPAAGAAPRSVVLITLDTTRADALGCYGGRAATPALDGLAARGLRYTGAVTPSPLTLPAHASLLTGLEPPEHGVLDNGLARLTDGVPTLATVLDAAGYATGAFVSSRVLDRRFGLARGFDVYDDRMAAEQTGEYGYPERDAAAVTEAALAWLKTVPRGRPFFVWIHYYDAHAPYGAPGASDAERYAGEVAAVDRQVARVLAALPPGAAAPVVAAVADHGESLGEHGERGHGLFLYGTVVRVPLIVAGPGVPSGRVVEGAVASRRLAATLLAASGAPGRLAGDVLPGVPGGKPPAPVYSETWLPATAYGWSPLRSWSDGRWRFVDAPRRELFDTQADPGETQNRTSSDAAVQSQLLAALDARVKAMTVRTVSEAAPDPATAEAIRSLGYLSGASGRRAGTLDPKDGLALLEELEAAKRLLDGGRAAEALPRLRALSDKSPGNVPFLGQLARAQEDAGDRDGAVRTLRHARDLNPRSDFAHLHLADALRRKGDAGPARQGYEDALAVNPRLSAAWLALAEMAKDRGGAAEERALLVRAADAGTESVALLTRLGQLELAAGALASAEGRLRDATALTPGFPSAWLLWGAVAERAGRPADALSRYERAVRLGPRDPVALLHLGRLRLKQGDAAAGRTALESVVRLAPGSAPAREAGRLLAAP